MHADSPRRPADLVEGLALAHHPGREAEVRDLTMTTPERERRGVRGLAAWEDASAAAAHLDPDVAVAVLEQQVLGLSHQQARQHRAARCQCLVGRPSTSLGQRAAYAAALAEASLCGPD